MAKIEKAATEALEERYPRRGALFPQPALQLASPAVRLRYALLRLLRADVVLGGHQLVGGVA